MQSSIREVHSERAYSPPQKKQCISGYPSPPSSGHNDREDGSKQVEDRLFARSEYTSNEVGLHQSQRLPFAEKEEVDVDRRVIEGWNTDSDSDDEEAYDDDNESGSEAESEGEMDVTITAMSRTASHASSSATFRSSASSTSADASTSRRERQLGSPYVQSKLSSGPIRDTPRNPFLEGGPADVGHAGPYGRTRQSGMPNHCRERGKMTYVFRGQRVTYADPYASDSDDDGSGPSTRGCMLDRLQPRLLFPSVGKASQRPPPAHLAKMASIPTAPMMKRRPTLDMTMGYQSGLVSEQTRMSAQQHLLDKIERAEWSDDDDDEPLQRAAYPFDEREQTGANVRSEDEDHDDEDMEEQEENPFMSYNAATQGNAAFIKRLHQTQTITTNQHRGGAIRSMHSNHRFNPYSKQ